MFDYGYWQGVKFCADETLRDGVKEDVIKLKAFSDVRDAWTSRSFWVGGLVIGTPLGALIAILAKWLAG
jgi:hypothetical protein